MNKKIIATLLCAVCLIIQLTATSFAQQASDTEALDTKKISLTIQYMHDSKGVSDIPFNLYYVASVNSNGKFTLDVDFKNYPVIINGLDSDSWKALATTLDSFAQRDNLTPLDSGKTNSSGTLTFPNNTSKLAPGLYLVSDKDHSDKVYNYKTSPFLIKLPSWDSVNKKEIYNVYAQPKFSADKITDSPDSSVTGIKVSKVWKDDIESKRPSEVTVQLLKDGKVYDQTTLNKSNG